eukprot:5294250-Prymnesium_polylepis.1
MEAAFKLRAKAVELDGVNVTINSVGLYRLALMYAEGRGTVVDMYGEGRGHDASGSTWEHVPTAAQRLVVATNCCPQRRREPLPPPFSAATKLSSMARGKVAPPVAGGIDSQRAQELEQAFQAAQESERALSRENHLLLSQRERASKLERNLAKEKRRLQREELKAQRYELSVMLGFIQSELDE